LDRCLDPSAERARVVATIERSLADVQAERGIPHAEVVAMLEQRYGPADLSDEGKRILAAAMALPDARQAALVVLLEDSVENETPLEEREALQAAVSKSLDQAERGDVKPVEQILARLREHRRR
jgi:predicted transcriptional regulator